MLLIPYFRVSSARQCTPGNPGLEAQRNKVKHLANAIDGQTADQEFIEIEASTFRPELNMAGSTACSSGAFVVVAKLYPLARDAEFLAKLAELDCKWREQGFKGFLFADIPRCEWPSATTLIADLAQFEIQASGKPIREALAVSKDRGTKLGGTRPETIRENNRRRGEAQARAEKLRPLLAPMVAQGVSYGEMARNLADQGIRTRNDNPLSREQVKRHLKRIGLL